ncbi:MAG: HAD family hydrolase [Candidatus Aminicenantes bacterium]|jgi:D-glycero-D-manno-heptose 1,7-bisphosphate phosphatase|nr:HAD family hydrolase [Candidatus Aminicenantes bacterium]
MNTKKAVFLDRDGTLNVDVGYIRDYGRVRLYPRGIEAVRRINRAGLLALVVTNQSGIGRGLLTEQDLWTIHAKMSETLAKRKARIDGWYYCPHYEESALDAFRKNCSCRKPGPGMALQAARDFGLDLGASYLIGDKVEDIEFGRAIGATPVLVLTGYGTRSLETLGARPEGPAFVAPDVLAAVRWILAREKRRRPGPGKTKT